MNLLIISRPGIRLFSELRRSETAWYALKFYAPVEIPIGIYVRISSLSAALSLTSDLKYFIRKYGTEPLFEIRPGVFCTSAVARLRYLSRETLPDPWPWKMWLHANRDGLVERLSFLPEEGFTLPDGTTNGDYILETLCNEEERSLLDFT